MTRTDERESLLRTMILAIVGVLIIATFAACSGAHPTDGRGVVDSASEANRSAPSPSTSQEAATIFAAASMQPVGDELTEAFVTEHPSGTLTWSYGGSSEVVRQIEQGAPADVFISADQANMDKALATQDFRGSEAKVIATNTLVLALPRGNPGKIHSLKDLPGTRVAICAPEVPCGKIAHEALAAQRITLDKPSEEPNVASVSTKVATGEVDAGFMYSTDAKAQASKGVTTVDIGGVAPNHYPVALTTRGQANATAHAFVQWLSSQTARQILARYGFTPADAAP